MTIRAHVRETKPSCKHVLCDDACMLGVVVIRVCPAVICGGRGRGTIWSLKIDAPIVPKNLSSVCSLFIERNYLGKSLPDIIFLVNRACRSCRTKSMV